MNVSERIWRLTVAVSIGFFLVIITRMVLDEFVSPLYVSDFAEEIDWEGTMFLLSPVIWIVYSSLIYLISWLWNRLLR